MSDKDLIVIGGGPAGLSAAVEAAKRGVRTLLIDENLKAGGQLFKQIHKFFGSNQHRAGIRGIDIAKELLNEAKKYDIEIWLDSVAIGIFEGKRVSIRKNIYKNSTNLVTIKAKNIIIATGASENSVRFDGWTLPGVMGAGAVQTMINVNRVLPGKKFLMIGSGNVGLIVAYQLLQAGADVIGVVEVLPEIGGYGVHASKISRAGVPIYVSHTILEAKGKRNVEEAVICKINSNWLPIKDSEKILEVDIVSIAAGLKPLAELAMMCGCECFYNSTLGGWVPIHNDNMESTQEGIYVVGDITGVEEANTALEEGRLAGISVAERLGYISTEESNKNKNIIWERLEELRLGPFGEERMKVKKSIIKAWNKPISRICTRDLVCKGE